ncbi:3583_t:CDS:2, partial [Gigaspora rosea]
PPVKSWNLMFHLVVSYVKNTTSFTSLPVPEAEIQSFDFKVPSNIIIKEVTLNEQYRQKSKSHLEKILKQYEDVLDDKWKEETKDRISGEWVYMKEDEESRNNEMDKVILHIHSGSFIIAPQNQFPASLCDTIAAYLYLIDPEPDAGFKPINPKKIVFVGESSGGGLALAILLFLRDAGLPLPGGAALLSPWLDLTHSMPSYWDTEKINADTLHSFNSLISPFIPIFIPINEGEIEIEGDTTSSLRRSIMEVLLSSIDVTRLINS